jgi:hypothetical protein
MSEALATYRLLEGRLWMERLRHEGKETTEEDAILDQMESAWMALRDDERSLLRNEGPRCWPKDPSVWPPEHGYAQSLPERGVSVYDGFHSPADAIETVGASR